MSLSEALAELICRGADESPIALLVIMRMFMVDVQIAVLEDELFAGNLWVRS